jgi:hypothetical protein
MTKEDVITVSILIVYMMVLSLIMSGCRGPVGPKGETGAPGAPGLEGLQGMPGTSFVGEVIDPCEDIPAQFPDVLFLISGTYYAVYASGQKIHLTPLAENVTYRTTDGRNCVFSLINGQVVR